MRKVYIGFLLLQALFLSNAFCQDFSNKGKDFWVGYGYNIRFVTNSSFGTCSGTNCQDMVLYFSADSLTNVTVSIPAVGYVANYVVPANTSVTTLPLPKAGAQDSRLTGEGLYNRGIHIVASKPIVAYAHNYAGNVSGASLLFPTNTLGIEYFAMNYTQKSNETSSNGYFFVCATDTGTTTVEITPSAATLAHVAGVPFQVNLTQGQIYNVMGQLTGYNGTYYTGVDLTGSKIKSLPGANGTCKKIAVFSGTGKMFINCSNAQAMSSDNFIVQSFPKSAWGQKFLTAPTKNMPYNYFRIGVSDPAAIVKVNGVVIPGPPTGGFYYDLPVTNQPKMIEADKPIMVAQYITSAGSAGNTCGNSDPLGSGNGDPEMIYISPIEQTIDKVILNSTPNYNITEHYINVITKTNAIGSVKLDGVNVSAQFVVHPADNNFSYAQFSVVNGQHTVLCDSGFNVIAYGYGPAESYGYNGGTNLKDLTQFIDFGNPFSIVSTPAACAGSPVYFTITLPYQPLQLVWDFHGFQNPNQTQIGPVADTTYFINGRQVWRYTLPIQYYYNIGNYPVTVLATTTSSEGCGSEQQIDFTLQVYNPPIADYTYVSDGCINSSIQFTDNSTLNGRPAYTWYWDFADGSPTVTTFNPSHTFTSPGTYRVRYGLITDIGCLSDTTYKDITVTAPPVINTQPVSKIVCSTGGTFFTVVATGSPLSYVWQVSTDGGGIWNDVVNGGIYSNANAMTLNISSVVGLNGYQYRVIVTSPPCITQVTSAVAILTVNTPSGNPATVTPSLNPICNGQSTTLTLNGGGGGTGEVIHWYTGSCGGTAVGTGNNLSVSPIVTTTYYGRYEDPAPCNNITACAQVTITVNQKSTDPVSAAASVNPICNGGSTFLSLNGGGGGTGVIIRWYTGSCGGTLVGTGNNLSVSPTTTTIYYGRYEDPAPCNTNSACATITVTVNQKSVDPISATVSVSPICNGDNTVLTLNGGGGGTGEIIKWYSASCGGTLVGIGNNLSVSPTITTIYYGRYEDPAPCSYNSACVSVTVTVNQKSTNPTTATGSVNPICLGGSTLLNLTGGAVGTSSVIKWYTASCGGTLVGTGNGLSVSPIVTTVYYGRYEDPAPCNTNSACASVTITVNTKSVDPVSAAVSVDPICSGSPTILTLNGGGGGTGAIIKWYTTSCGGILAGTGNNLSVTPATTTTYYGRYEDPAPCSNNTACASITVTVAQKSVNPVSATASVNPICNGGSTILTLNGGGGGSGAVIKWYTTACGGTLIGTGNNISVNPSATTTYFGRYEDPAPCNTNTLCAAVTVTVNTISIDPISASVSVNPICSGSSTPLTLNGGGGGTSTVVKWYTSSCGGTLVGSGNNLTVNPITTTTYYGRYEDPAPCNTITSCASVTVTVAQKSTNPASAAASVNPICIGSSTVLTLAGGGGGTGAVIKWYSTSCGGIFVGTGNNLTVSPLTTTIYYGRYEDPAPCNTNTACATVTVIVNTKSIDPTSAVASINPICRGTSTQLLLSGGTIGVGATVRWYTSSCGGVFAGTGNNLSVSPVATTTYYGRYEDASPCNTNTNCASVTVTVNQPPANPVSATAILTTICNGNSAVLTLNGGGGGTGEVIKWYSDSCSGTLVGIGNNLTVTPTTTTTFYGRYEVSAPCSNSACAPVTITVNNPPAITIHPSGIGVCAPTPVSFSVTATGTNPTYQWQVSNDGGGTWVNVINGGIYSGATSTTLNISNTNNLFGNKYRAIVTGTAPCSFVISNPATLAAFTVQDITGNSQICVSKPDHGGPNTSQLSDITPGGIWASTDPSVALIDPNGIVSAVSPGNTTIYYTVTSVGCVSKAFPVTVHNFNMSVSPSNNRYQINLYEQITLQTASTDNYNVILWEPVSMFPDQNAKFQTFAPLQTEIYSVTGELIPFGCTDTTHITIIVNTPADDIFVANAFTPNGDGTNDKVFVRGNKIKEFDMRIFNQWGQEVFQTSDKYIGWDGTVRGKKQPVGVYVYVLKAIMMNGKEVEKKGSITLIR